MIYECVRLSISSVSSVLLHSGQNAAQGKAGLSVAYVEVCRSLFLLSVMVGQRESEMLSCMAYKILRLG
jgi:hypothetical protein